MSDQSDVSLDGISRALTLIALFGCATKDATPEQRARLKGEALPMLRDTTSNPLTWVVERIFDIMGDGWNPVHTGNGWGEWLDQLLRERADARQAT